MNANSNVNTASRIIDRALAIADISNTDFLSYEELTNYLNDAWKNVYQKLINNNLDVFTSRARLYGSGGVYKLPWDCWQIKTIRNMFSGRQIVRRADSESIFEGYEIINDKLVMAPSVGEIEIVYWRKPFWLSIPNKTRNTLWNGGIIVDVCRNSVLYRDALGTDEYKILNLETDDEITISIPNEDAITLAPDFIVGRSDGYLHVYDLNGTEIDSFEDDVDYMIKSDDGMILFGRIDEENKTVRAYKPGTDEVVMTMKYEGDRPQNLICINEKLYQVQYDCFPIGVFDGRAAYTKNTTLCLINEDGTEITEPVHIPSYGDVVRCSYGFLTRSGKLYSNIPDTVIDFPSNLYYDVLAYDLAVRFLAKQNADASGVENLNRAAWVQLRNSLDQGADFLRIKKVR